MEERRDLGVPVTLRGDQTIVITAYEPDPGGRTSAGGKSYDLCHLQAEIIAQTGMAGLKNCIKFAPSFVTSRDEIDQAIDIFSQSLKAVESASRT